MIQPPDIARLPASLSRSLSLASQCLSPIVQLVERYGTLVLIAPSKVAGRFHIIYGEHDYPSPAKVDSIITQLGQ